ncbi:MetQ/NlpA family ABC transporter substrate-binding protein [Cellulomonas edaphi]|uniref:MetQ/NlpA family ABC transporter substrate-binding protein n=1 Tax=Cellulomonas edaphi TaxID=3053468 RepID=A0ABT7S7Y6_9CELL|nr:MetQ/NlpA family ABC transporter substrate-binding protein [Cellulomons edaphi]MDM7831639.1 MetQ/NlpA family ABC transporter substrate-binding protein [Cellulomons edaphi]
MFRTRRTTRRLTGALVAGTLALALAACSSSDGDAAKGSEANPVQIGVVGASGDQWKVFTQLAEKQDIHVKLVDFTDYQQPNPATTSGELDLNQFQHILFLADYDKNAGADLVPIGSTAIYPLALYSKKYTSLDEIPAGAQIAIPNDGTNQARALGVLASAKLITLKAGTPSLSAAPADVDTSASKVKVVPVAADQTGRSLDDSSVAGAVINNDYVADIGLDPTKTLAQDDPSSDAARPYINIWATRAKDKDNATYVKLVKIAQEAEVEDALKKNSGGTAVIVHETPAKLQTYLTDVQDQLAANG